MKSSRSFVCFFLATLIVGSLSALTTQTVQAKTCYGPGHIVVPCPTGNTHPTKAVPPTATATATQAGMPVTGGQSGPDSGQAPNAGGPSGLVGGYGFFIGLLMIVVAFVGGVAVGYTSKPGTPPGGSRQEPSVGLNASDLANLAHQINPSAHVPQAHGADGSLAGLNRALNRAGFPGLGGDGKANDDHPEGHAVGGYEIQPTGEDGTYKNGGYTIETSTGWTIIYAYDNADQTEAHLVAVVTQEMWKDPVPDDDTPGGSYSLPRDGSGKVRPRGDVLDLENMPGPPADLHGDLNNLAHLNEHANLGGSSGPGTQHGGATDPDPSGDGDSNKTGDVGDLKQIQSSYDATYDPSPEHPLSDSGESAGKVSGP